MQESTETADGVPLITVSRGSKQVLVPSIRMDNQERVSVYDWNDGIFAALHADRQF
jgi:hypothetical protein